MRLGTQTGSLTNHLMARESLKPTVGDGATILQWTDRDAATVIAVEEVKGGWIVTVQEDNAKRTDTNGMSESQTYEYTPNPEGSKYSFRSVDSSQWRQVRKNEKGRWVYVGPKGEGYGLTIGTRKKYHDFSF